MDKKLQSMGLYRKIPATNNLGEEISDEQTHDQD